MGGYRFRQTLCYDRGMNRQSPRLGIRRIVSGGQTGVDRGALDAAISLGIQHGGWCPLGRLAEDGPIPKRYQLKETDATEYWVRTEQNVIDSDGTLILHAGRLSGGTEFTYRMTQKHRKPCLLVNLKQKRQKTPLAESARQWIVQNRIAVINVAGPRESSCRGIQRQARAFVESVFLPSKATDT